MHLVKRYRYYILLTLVVGVLAFVNHQPNTFLTGWDNLQTELNPTLAIKRALFSVWQEYQSFGLTAGMAHAADFPRALFGLLLSLILPVSLVRYMSQMLCILVGALGAYTFFAHSISKTKKEVYAFLGALFYLFNLGTIQILSLPFETFSLFYAFFPWLLYIFVLFLETEHKLTKKKILTFVFVNLIASSFAVSQQLFVVYGLTLAIFSLCHFFRKPSIQMFARITLAGTLILVVNLYWILPQMYFLKTNGTVVKSSKINQLSTEDIYYRNLEKGTIDQFIYLKNFFLDTVDKKNTPMLLPWLQWHEFWFAKYALLILTTISFIGLLTRKKYSYELRLILFLLAVALLSNTPYIKELNAIIRNNPFINQIFRSPFTKFVIPYSFVTSLLFVYGLVTIETLFYFIPKKAKRIVLSLCVIVLMMCISYPAFDGYFYPHEMQTDIPQSYFKLMSYMHKQDMNKRIALLPDYTYWGWFFNSWGYNGSGFIWYGIEQPIISRTFDVWSQKSENYYWEIKQAIESENPTLFQRVADKYNVSYFILDESLLPITSSIKGMQYDRLEHILPNIPSVKKIQQWGKLSLYENINQSSVQNFLESKSAVPHVGPQIEQINLDSAFETNSTYITSPARYANDSIFPFLDLMSQTQLSSQTWKIEETNREFIISDTTNIPPLTHEVTVPFDHFEQIAYTDQGIASRSGYIYVNTDEQNRLSAHIPKILIRSFDIGKTEMVNCGKEDGILEHSEINGVRIRTDNGASACFGYNDQTLDQNYGYIVKITSKNLQGRPLLFYTLDLTKKESVIEDRLKQDVSYYVIPQRFRYGLGYNFSFQQNSYQNIPSENELTEISLYAFPISELQHIQIVKKDNIENPIQSDVNMISKKYSYYQYSVNYPFTVPKNTSLILYQTYDVGWFAYRIPTTNAQLGWFQINMPFLFGTIIKEHVLVNNWANGWQIPTNFNSQTEQIAVIFWPQYLEYAGFGAFGITFLIILLWKKHHKKALN
ncbi:MAG: hypothetical protein WA061_06185 [Microgenomates group bacterium]